LGLQHKIGSYSYSVSRTASNWVARHKFRSHDNFVLCFVQTNF
jgi:hypothetical protein